MPNSTVADKLSKVPQVTLLFWIMKIIATTLGETAGDAVTMSLQLGYLVGTIIFTLIFLFAIFAQMAVKRFYPFLFWFVIIATTTTGTALADLLDRSLGIGYASGVSILLILLMLSFGLWIETEGSVTINAITSRRAELFYWITILFSQTLGTALGDCMADTAGFGYDGSATIFTLGLALVAAMYYCTRLSPTLLFWLAFILTRPLGATLGDFLDKPIAHGGLALSRYTASLLLFCFIIFCIICFPQKANKQHQD